MTFLRISWKIIVGLKDLLVLLLLLLFFALLFAALSASPNPGMVREGALWLKLDGVVSEQPAEVDPLTALTSTAMPVSEIRQRDIIRSLKIAESDKRIKAVVLDMDRRLATASTPSKRRASRSTPLPPPIPTTATNWPPTPHRSGWIRLAARC
jgi:hypothetical protein